MIIFSDLFNFASSDSRVIGVKFIEIEFFSISGEGSWVKSLESGNFLLESFSSFTSLKVNSNEGVKDSISEFLLGNSFIEGFIMEVSIPGINSESSVPHEQVEWVPLR